MGRTNAAKVIGLKRRTVLEYAAVNPDFALDQADAEGEPLDELYEAAMALGTGYKVQGEDGAVYVREPNLDAIKFLLPRLDRDRYGDKVVHEHKHQLDLTDPAQLEALESRLLRRQQELGSGVVIDTVVSD